MISTNYSARGNKRISSKALMDEQTCLVQPRLEQICGSNVARLVQQIYFWLHSDGFTDSRMGEVKTRWYRGRKYANIPPDFFTLPFRGAFRAWSQPTLDRAIRDAKKCGVLGTANLGGQYNSNWYCVYDDNIGMLSHVYDQFDSLVEHEWNEARKNENAQFQTLPRARQKEIWNICKKHLEAAKKQARERVEAEKKSKVEPSSGPKVDFSFVDDEIETDFWSLYQNDGSAPSNSPVKTPVSAASPQLDTPPQSESAPASVNLGGSAPSEGLGSSVKLIEPLSFIGKEQQQRGIEDKTTKSNNAPLSLNSFAVASTNAPIPEPNSYVSPSSAAPPVQAREISDADKIAVIRDLTSEVGADVAEAMVERFGVDRCNDALDELFDSEGLKRALLDEMKAQVADVTGTAHVRTEEAPRPQRERVAAVTPPNLFAAVIEGYKQVEFTRTTFVRQQIEKHGENAMWLQLQWAIETEGKKPEEQRKVAELLGASFRDKYGPLFKTPEISKSYGANDTAEAVRVARENAERARQARATLEAPNSGAQAPNTPAVEPAHVQNARIWEAASEEERQEALEDAAFAVPELAKDPKLLLIQAQSMLVATRTLKEQRGAGIDDEDEDEEAVA